MWWKPKPVRKALQKLQVANEIIGTIYANKFPNVQQFVFNSSLEVRNVHTDKAFQGLGAPSEIEKALIEASDPRILMTTSLENRSPYFRVYTFGDVFAYDDTLYGACVEKIVNQTFAAVGLATPDREADKIMASKLRVDN